MVGLYWSVHRWSAASELSAGTHMMDLILASIFVLALVGLVYVVFSSVFRGLK